MSKAAPVFNLVSVDGPASRTPHHTARRATDASPGGPGDDHRQRLQVAPDRVEHEAERLERDGTEEGRIAGFAEDDGRGAAAGAVDEDGVAALTIDRRAVGEPKPLAPVRLDAE